MYFTCCPLKIFYSPFIDGSAAGAWFAAAAVVEKDLADSLKTTVLRFGMFANMINLGAIIIILIYNPFFRY
jgi:hypothetical protein